jgi:putative restriction endonuclease
MSVNFLNEVQNINVHRVGQVVSLHKPLLLLLTIGKIFKGDENLFLFDDIEHELVELISKYGLKNTSRINAQYPFIYLASNSKIWSCSINKANLAHPDAASRRELLGSFGSFTSEFYNYLLQDGNLFNTVELLLNQYWPEAYHAELLNDIGLFDFNLVEVKKQKKERGRKFIENVLDAYERKCAICHQSIRLGDALIGIDACHVKPIQHFGDDNINNGIALCKIHHWALDRGAISISQEMSLLISKKLNGNKLHEYFTSFENVDLFVPRDATLELSKSNLEYHTKYIFVK